MGIFKQHMWLRVVSGILLLQYISCDCPLPENDFPHGEVKLLDVVEVDNQTLARELSLLQFTCSDGYLRIGPEYIQCVDSKWSSEAPFCAGMKCLDPPVLTNATYAIESGVNTEPLIGSLAVYSCKAGFELADTNVSSLTCKINEETKMSAWEGELPVCKEKTSCPVPVHSVHGNYSGDCCSSGDTLRFSCNEGYELVGEAEMRCLRSGDWSSRRPLCRPLSPHCELPPKIAHGLVRASTGKMTGDYFLPGEEAQVLCEPGYACKGNEFLVCKREGRWEGDFGMCKEVFCEPPPPLAHGSIPELKSNLTIFPYGFGLTYACNQGYRINRGDSWRMCEKNGWSGRTPRCELIRCPDPGEPENGFKLGTDYTVGSRVRFSCFSDYELLGSVEMVCKLNGEWTGEVARCNIQSNYCPNPGIPISGSKNTTVYRKGDRVRFQCQQDTILLGSEVRECLEDRTWSGEPTKCVDRYVFDNGAHVRDMLREKLAEKREQQQRELDRFNRELRSSVYRKMNLNFPGRIILYFAFDVSGSVSTNNFRKSIDFAKAIVRKVNITLDGARAGAVAFGSRAEQLFLPLAYDSTEDVLQALDRVQYTGGGTSASSALNLIREGYIPVVKNTLKGKDIKSVVFILTDGKANMGGDPQEEARLLKKQGVEIFCVGITGDVRRKTLYDIASSSLYGAETRPNVFMLQDYATLAWLVQEITNGTIDYSQCGLGMENIGVQHAKIVGGNVSAEPWPWMVALYTSEGNPPTTELTCGGSIIHQHFVLTAAHCMFDGERQLLKKRDIHVKLGLTDLSNATYLQEMDVRRIHLHPLYRHYTINRSLDYDIALLELERPIQYNAFIRPICLPPPELPADSRFYKPKELVYMIGWGHTQVVSKAGIKYPTVSPVLKEIGLPIQSKEICNKSLEGEELAPKFTNRMFCAGTGQGKEDTCVGDSGGPVMQAQENREGYLSWTQVGVVSWGLGCGLKNEYGFYTHLHEVMPWVRKTTEAALQE